MQLAKILRSIGFHITFVNNEFNHRRLISSLGEDFVKGEPDFQFETIPDGLPESDKDSTQSIAALCDGTRKHCYAPLKELVKKLNNTPHVPQVTSIMYDGLMGFARKVAKDLGLADQQFWTASACGLLGYLQFDELVQRNILPYKEWIEGMKDIRMRDLPSFVRTTTLDDISPLQFLGNHFPDRENGFKFHGSNLWKNDVTCFKWLDQWEPDSVIYVNYGSIAVMSEEHLNEFAWGLANSKLPFLWIKRPDLVKGKGKSSPLPQDFLDEVKDRGYITSWCPQSEVLGHSSVGAFLTHCGWNSSLESICEGKPMIGWPFFAEQQTNCRFICNTWGIGMDIKDDVKREEVTELVVEMIKGEKGKEMREKCQEWKRKVVEAADTGGSSYNDFNRLLKEVYHYDVV
ncbi:hypothetical protein RYX36_015267 [Vicia faba]